MAEKAPFGWVGGGKRPARVHKDKDCVESYKNPRTGKKVKAVPATRAQRENLPQCSYCFG